MAATSVVVVTLHVYDAGATSAVLEAGAGADPDASGAKDGQGQGQEEGG